eukprot:TRINITY_DN609_c0_g1_i1.p1 TRINITY_DN609_c0_g1~~TRINITY_DN609_c0_g1_i1.p1  ORF type:complete len:856 (+),score=121.05 TRINITY_DN609_c0_g1_i1:116-2683(+)
MESRRRAKRVAYSVGRPVATEHVLGGLNCIEDLSNVGIVATGGRDGVVRLWRASIDSHVPQMEAALEGHMDWVNDLAWIEDGSGNSGLLASCSSDSQIKIWDISSNTSITASLNLTLSPHADYVKKIKWNPHLQMLASGSFDGRVALSNIEVASKSGTTSKGVYQFAEVYQSVYSLDTYDNLIAVGTTRPAISLLDVRSGRLETYLKGHKDMIKGLRFLSSHPNLLTSSSSDGTIKVWDTRRSERAMMTIAIHSSPVWALESLSIPMPCEISLLSGSKDGNIMLTLVGYKGSQYSRSASSSLLVSSYGTPVLDFKVVSNGFDSSPALWCASSSVEQPLSVYNIGVPLSSSVIAGFTPKHLPVSTSPPPAQTPPQRIPRDIAPLSATSPFTPSPSASDGTVTLHTLVASHLDRHSFSLSPSVRAACSPALKSGDTTLTDEDDDRAKCAAVSSALGVAMNAPSSVCRASPPIVKAKLLDNRRHCVTADCNNFCQLWDISTGERVAELGEVSEFDKKVSELSAKYPRVALHSWCSVDVSSGHLVVLLDHPGVFSCYTTLWEKDVSTPLLKSNTPPKLSHSELLLAKAEKPINFGETILLGLFKKLLKINAHRYLFDDGKLPLNPQKRNDWWTGELAATTSESQIVRVGSVFPEATCIYIWSLREAGTYTPNRDDVIEVGSTVFAPYDAEPYQKHVMCTVSNCNEFLNIPNGPSLPQWVNDMMDDRELSLPNSRVPNVTFSLKAFGSDLPELPKNSCRLSGSPRIRLHKVAEEVSKILRIKLPTRVSWETLDIESPASTPSEVGTDAAPNPTVLPEEYIELLAGGKRIDPLWSLSTVDKFFRGTNSKELVIYYRKCTPD